MFVSADISYSLAYEAIDATDDDNLMTALSAQIQISIVLIGMVRKLIVKLMILPKQWVTTLQRALKMLPATTNCEIRTMHHP